MNNKTQFEISSWDEKPYLEAEDNIKLTRATITKSYSGDVSGKGTLEYLMAYKPDGSAHFVGIEHFKGNIGSKSGTVIFSHEGTFQEGTASSSFQVIEGSATGKLKGITGEGSFSTGHARTVPVVFKYKM